MTPVMPALVLVLLLNQAAPDITVTMEPHALVVAVTPPAGRTVKAVAVEPREGKPLKPRGQTREKQRVRATFERPHANSFLVIVTLDDGAVHRVKDPPSVYVVKPFLGDVLPPRSLPPPY